MRLEQGAGSELLEANRRAAEAAYREALRLDPEQPRALLGMGRLAEDRGQLREAGDYYVAYVRAAPEASDRALVIQRVARITRQLEAEKEPQ